MLYSGRSKFGSSIAPMAAWAPLIFAVPYFCILASEASASSAPSVFLTAVGEKFACPESTFLCPSGRCIPRHWTCDGENDCGDDADEKNCETRVCQESEFKCLHSNKCISAQWTCDGSDDCGDNSDESPALCSKKKCSADEFRCLTDGKCIPSNWVCDGRPDCMDNSDEQPEHCSSRNCNSLTEFRCRNGWCIPKKWECDRDDDCGDNSDEHERCTYLCNASDFQCKIDKRCIPQAWVCDGQLDCPDLSDEANCTAVGRINGHVCKMHEFQCRDGACINKKFVCDGDMDCPDYSDEENCNRNCTLLQFQCLSDGKCIAAALKCNDQKDCADGSDEQNCAPSVATKPQPMNRCDPAKEFSCGNSFCIPWKLVCDKKADCPGQNALDEEPYVNCTNKDVDFCASKPCHHVCTNTPLGASCSCNAGYTVAPDNPKRCVDVDECQKRGICSQVCVNTEGSYECRCHHGYMLLLDNRSCRATGQFPKLLLSNRLSIRQIDLLTMASEPLISNISAVVAIDYSYRRKTLFWSDVKTEKIYACKLTPNHVISDINECMVPVVSDKVTTPDGLAVDWVHDLLYWTDTGRDTISVARFDGSMRRTLVNSDLDEPRAIVVDPACGVMFWTDWGGNAKIERAGMDGSNRTVVVADTLWPNGLTLDLLEHRLYWVDAKLKQICSSDYFGQDKNVILTSRDRVYHPFSIAMFEERLYWTDWNTNGVHVANKFTGDNSRVVLNGIFGFMTVKVFHPAVQPDWPNKCDNNDCQQLCIPTLRLSKGSVDKSKVGANTRLPYVCLCADGYQLAKDGRTCQGVAQPPVTAAAVTISTPAAPNATQSVVLPADHHAGDVVQSAAQVETDSKTGMTVSVLILSLMVVCAVGWAYWKRRSFNVHFNRFFSLSYPFCRRSQDQYDHLRLTLENDEYPSGSLMSGSSIYQPTVKGVGRHELSSTDASYMLGRDSSVDGPFSTGAGPPAGAVA